uniref:Copper type II ascorbate-dependent monooxygenase C-terminal domain-containing protein n=1 Tax=Pinctada fucata TaxID=50426 RepID=A0A194APP9_PINFU
MYFQSYSLINTGYIPSKQTKGFFSEVACPWKLPPVYAFRYFTHTHHHGYFVEGFRVRNGTWTLIGSQLVKLKKTDYMTIPGGPLLIKKGDALVSRCFYINPQDKDIQIGLKFDDEMCNFDIDFGYDPKFKESFGVATACETETPAFSLCDHKEVNGLCS